MPLAPNSKISLFLFVKNNMSQTETVEVERVDDDDDESSFQIKLTGNDDDDDYNDSENEDEQGHPKKKSGKGRGKSPMIRPAGTKIKQKSTKINKWQGKGAGKRPYYGGKGLGKGYPKRHKRPLRDNILGITRPAIRRLARRGGVKRISGLIYDDIRKVLKEFLEQNLKDAITYMEHGKRKTVTTNDVMYALLLNGRPMYGFGQ
jgi:histone H4